MAPSARRKPGNHPPEGAPHPLDFFGELVWINGAPLLGTIELYRRKILTDVLWTFDDDGVPQLYNLALCGRGKKNWKPADLVLKLAFYRFFAWPIAGRQ